MTPPVYTVAKRTLDLVVASLGLLVLSPVLAVVAVLVRIRIGSPVLFVQERPGRHGAPFRLYKFRTMTDDRGPDGALLPDADRLTRLGRTLRRASLDELPELVNVVRGDMSLVGPRPLLTEYLDHYTPEQARRHEVRPGITGWAQVHGRNDTTWDERFAHDRYYLEHRSFGLDLRILARTLAQVFRGTGVTQTGQATMVRFDTPDGGTGGGVR